ncbi:MAG: transporter substrate-binding domain-containing protein [Clostridia bacterium]|nr:transporter substrate-binding domain-containing protein [Clostridia bacterium]
MKKIIALLMAALLVFAFAGCTDTKVDEESSTNEALEDSSVATASDLEYVKSKGTLVVGITDFAPMDYEDENGNWVGFDADMATAFAKSLGVEVQFVEINWKNKVMELDGKNIDVVWNGMTLTDEVKSAMSCSNAYCNNAQVVIVKAEDASKYVTADDCKELNFAVETGSAGKDMAAANNFKYTEVKDQATALSEVKAGTSDAAIIDSLMAAAMVGEGTGFEDLTYTVKLNSEEYGVGFRKGSDLVDKLNDFFKASYADGSMQKIAETYGVQAALIEQ